MRTVGIEDGSFIPRVSKKCLFVAVLMDNIRIIDVQIKTITVDGMDVTDKTIEILRSYKSVDCLISGGITFAGFNILDPFRIFNELDVPVIIVSRKKPNNKAIYNALVKHFKDWQIRWNIVKKLGEPIAVYNWRDGVTLYVELVGIDKERALEIIDSLTLWGKRPEPLRVANIIAKGLSNVLEIKTSSP